MKIYLFIIVLSITIQPIFCQEKDALARQQLSVDFGSLRNRYLYPITDLKYSSPIVKKINLKFLVRLRSYGTLFFYSKSAYDFTNVAEYYFTKTVKPIYFSTGIGLDTRIRLVKDERTETESSAEPLISFTMHGSFHKLLFNAPLWTRFYSNGISYLIQPEVSYKIGNSFSIFIRYELSYLSIYRLDAHEWRQDCFIGTQLLF